MKTKIKDTLLSNLGLKLLSLVVAAVLWFVVVNVEIRRPERILP